MRPSSALVVAAVALGSMACSRGDKSKDTPAATSSPRVPIETAPIPSGDPRGKPECVAPRACLRDALPMQYDPTQTQSMDQRARACLGGTMDTAWALKDCLPFEFARDPKSGLNVQVAMNCAEQCPAFASLAFEFATPLTEFECVCRGFYPVRPPGPSRYEGCAPRPPIPRGQFFDLIDAADGKIVAVQGDPRFGELGFLMYSIIDSIDGVKVSTRDEISRGLAAIPGQLPGTVHFHRDSPQTIKELHYVTRETAESLGKLSAELGLRDLAEKKTKCLNPEGDAAALRAVVRVLFGGPPLPSGVPPVLFRKPECVDEESKRVLKFEEAVHAAGNEAKPRSPVEGQGTAVACKDVEPLRSFAVGRGPEEFEVRYVDWAK